MKKIIALLMAMAYSYGDCSLGYDVLYLLAKVEKHPKRSVGYPFLISFNNREDINKLVESGFNYERLDNRSIDCLNLNNCVEITRFLQQNKINNIDVGGFQINTKWHKYELEKYFMLKQSSLIACSIMEDIIERNNGVWSWDILATYHSSTPEVRERYKQKLIQHSKEL